MDRSLYIALTKRASDLFDAGEHGPAIEIFEKLVVEGDLPDLDRAMMCINLATVHHKAGDVGEALANYARALDYEQRTDSYFVAQQRAAFLSQIGRHDDSVQAYRELVERPDVKPEDRSVFEANISVLESLLRQ